MSSETPNGFVPRFNISHVQNGLYRTIGQMISTIIVQGVEPPSLLSPIVVDYFLSGNVFEVDVTPNDVADGDLREALNMVQALKIPSCPKFLHVFICLILVYRSLLH